MNAAAYLSSQGWEGPNRALQPGGIAKPVLVSRKKDQAGIGRERISLGDTLNHAFDSALKSFDVHGSRKHTPSSTASPQSGLYANFVKAGTMEDRAPKCTEDVKMETVKMDTDERQARKKMRMERRKARAERREDRALRELARKEARRKRESHGESKISKR